MRVPEFLRAAASAAALALFAALPAVSRGDSLEASVSAREVVTGDPFRVTVEWSGSAIPVGEPVFERPEAATLAGPQTGTQTMIVNGRVSRTFSWSWVAEPDAPGVVDFGEVRFAVDGRLYTARVPAVRVGDPPPQPLVRLSLSSDKPEVLPEETFTVTLALEVALPSVPDSAPLVSPFDPSRPPLLRIPHLGGGAEPGFCEPESDPATVLGQFVARDGSPGVRVNSFVRREDPFASMGFGGFGGFGGGFPSMFGESRPLLFAFPSELFEENGTNFVRHSVSASFRATGEGRCAFPPARFEGSVLRSVAADGRATASRPIVALSPPLSVAVVPPPREGRPASFFGALGKSLSPSVSLDAQTCRQGDPLTLELRLEGDLFPRTVREPDIFAAPGMADLFRAWGEAEKRDDGGVPVFRYRVRPVAAGTIEVPPVPLSFFDTETRTYKTVETAPVPLRVDPVADFDPAALFAAAATNGAALQLSVAQSGPVAPSLSLDPSGAAPRRAPRAATVAFFALVPPALWILAVVLPGLPGAVRRSRAALRRGGARGRAAARLRSAETPQEALDAVRRLLRDRWGEDLPGLTPSDLADALARHGAPEEPSREAVRLLQETFDESFRPGADVRAAVRSRRGALADALLAALRALPPLVLLAAALPASAQGTEAEFRWRRAAAAAAVASAPEDFLAVARDYRGLAEDVGAPSAVLYENLGASLLQAGCKAEALDAFARAEAVGGANAATQAGTALASGAEPSWLRTLLAWHYAAPLAARRAALAAAWCALWLLLAAARLFARRRRAALADAAFAAALCAALGASLAADARLLASPLPPVPDSPPEEVSR